MSVACPNGSPHWGSPLWNYKTNKLFFQEVVLVMVFCHISSKVTDIDRNMKHGESRVQCCLSILEMVEYGGLHQVWRRWSWAASITHGEVDWWHLFMWLQFATTTPQLSLKSAAEGIENWCHNSPNVASTREREALKITLCNVAWSWKNYFMQCISLAWRKI